MNEEYLGKVVLITGASSGIGVILASHFSKLGANLSLIGRNLENLEKTKQKCCIKENFILLTTADLTKEDDLNKILVRTIEQFGKLDVLINNAGIYETDTIETGDIKLFDRIFNTNVRSIYALTKLAVPYLIATKGNIVNISSLTGIRPFPWCLSYTMSKAALDQFTRCTALELAPKQIRVNNVNPGSVFTEAKQKMAKEKLEEFTRICEKIHPMRRPAEMQEIAECVAFLASNKACFITGTNIPLDGGRQAACSFKF